MQLSHARPGDVLVVDGIADTSLRLQCLRLGLHEGKTLQCLHVLPEGPVIVRCGTCELAIGRPIARNIAVRPAGAAPATA